MSEPLVFDHVPLQTRMDAAIDEVLDTLDAASAADVEIDPLATIIDRIKARGAELDLEAMPPLMKRSGLRQSEIGWRMPKNSLGYAVRYMNPCTRMKALRLLS